MKDALLGGLWACARFLFYTALWEFVLFQLGSLALRVGSLGRYPRRRIESHPDGTALLGVLVLVLAWIAIVSCHHLAPTTGALHG